MNEQIQQKIEQTFSISGQDASHNGRTRRIIRNMMMGTLLALTREGPINVGDTIKVNTSHLEVLQVQQSVDNGTIRAKVRIKF